MSYYSDAVARNQLSSAHSTISRLRRQLREIQEAFEVYTGAGPYRSPGVHYQCDCPCTGKCSTWTPS